MDTPHLEELYFLERDGCKYNGLAFDGCNFYLSAQNTIHVFDSSMRKLDQVETCQRFTSICYDPYLDCFWALSADERQYAYRLNRMLREIDRIVLPYNYGKPTGISCGENENELLIASGESLYCIAKSGGINAQPIKHMPREMLICACVADEGYLYASRSTLRRFTPCGMSCGIILPEGYVPIDMANGCCPHEVFLLAVKDCYYFRIIRCSYSGCCCKPCKECCELCKDCEPCEEPCCDLCEEDHCAHCDEPCCDSCCDVCEEPCCEPCHEPCRPKPHKEQELCDVIESIALVETALSHILNAEGEKLQKVLEISNDPEMLLETNKSISKTISKVTHLEYVLFQKLQAIQEMSEYENEKADCCEPSKHHCDCLR